METKKTEEVEVIFTDKNIIFRVFYSEVYAHYNTLYTATIIGGVYNILFQNFMEVYYVEIFTEENIGDLNAKVEVYLSFNLCLKMVKRCPITNSYFSN